MIKVKLVIMSHLKDANYEMECFGHELNAQYTSKRLKFIEQLVFKYPDTNTEISDEELAEIWAAL
jgi:hypothetical protein